MTRFVFHGEGHTTGGGDVPVGLVLLVVAAMGISAALAAIMAALAIILACAVVVSGGALYLFWRISRPNPRDAELLAERWAAMRQPVRAPQPTTVIIGGHHYHGLRAPAPQVIQGLPVRDAIIEGNERT